MEITIPYQYNPRPYQLELLNSNARFKIAVFHRRGGKSKTALNDQVNKTQKRKGIYYYFLPTYKQAKQVIWDGLVKEHIPKEIVEKINDSELAIYYKNGSIQRFAGCEDIDKHRGINPIDVVFDEYSEIKEEMWTAIIQPVLRENKGTATFIFTPKGRNHAWKLIQQAKDKPDWFYIKKDVYETDAISREEIKDAKKETPLALFEQEYLCKFLDDAGSFFTELNLVLYEAYESAEYGHVYQLGVDLAKYQDWTVLTPFDKSTFKIGKQVRFNHVDWNLQKARIEAEARKYNNARIVIDSTGVGDPITEDLERTELEVEPFKFTETSRRQLLDNLSILIQQHKVQIPNDEGLLDEMRSMAFRLTDRGKLKVQVPEGLHDDRIMSLALAVWEAGNPIPINENQTEFNLYKQSYA